MIYGFNSKRIARRAAALARQNSPNAYRVPANQMVTRNWVVKAPSGGIPAINGDTPGSAECKTYVVLNGQLKEESGQTFNRTVYNLGNAVEPDAYKLAIELGGQIILENQILSQDQLCEMLCGCDLYAIDENACYEGETCGTDCRYPNALLGEPEITLSQNMISGFRYEFDVGGLQPFWDGSVLTQSTILSNGFDGCTWTFDCDIYRPYDGTTTPDQTVLITPGSPGRLNFSYREPAPPWNLGQMVHNCSTGSYQWVYNGPQNLGGSGSANLNYVKPDTAPSSVAFINSNPEWFKRCNCRREVELIVSRWDKPTVEQVSRVAETIRAKNSTVALAEIINAIRKDYPE